MRKYLSLLPVAALLSACSTPTAHFPSAPLPSTWPVTQAPAYVNKVWWTQGSDNVLLNLLATADQQSHDIRIATARLQEARAAHTTARSLLFPDIAAAGVVQRGDVGLTYGNRTINIAQGELDASYDLDLFGGLKARSKAAKAGAAAAESSLEDVKGAVRLEIIAAYIGLRQCQQNLASLQITSASAHDIADSLREQWQKGLITEGQWRTADSEARAADMGVSRYTDACEQYINVLSVLTGDDEMALRETLTTPGKMPTLRHTEAINTPMPILRDRPDMRIAESNLTAARASTRSAQAALFPNLSIGAFFGRQDTSVGPSVDVWNTAATVYWPLLNFGRIKGQINAASAREVQAYEGYRLTAIAALADVRTKWVALEQAELRARLADADLEAALRRHDEADRQYRAGLTPKIAWQASHIQLETARRALTDTEADRSLKAAALYRAQGL
ncbi:efflux transporter outer membrane subunit [Asticcacaulis excentricus]|uniref:RND efflux system, outer membrane lipoprotein, NodT family n=1 Tax=Asticcacaulis excentricus (strain ATCC 15261 / DSM 4724 / KCTC 12464 / NCIMB 9791 / VKM B-1370 / CB 48) TaxID=573065 RepID=E8RVE5_ASTEC|nr:efflux transporter outer membrane subunit [Asticcacaulis excentricus]ADU15286.1 RND efflux system, outer membrane lipoprotein, NodT family [Asticcacaulis excentricus CB 48]